MLAQRIKVPAHFRTKTQKQRSGKVGQGVFFGLVAEVSATQSAGPRIDLAALSNARFFSQWPANDEFPFTYNYSKLPGVVVKLDAAMRTLHSRVIGWPQLAAQDTLVSMRCDQAPVHSLVAKNAKNAQRGRKRRGIILFLIGAHSHFGV